MSREERERLHDILEAIAAIRGHVAASNASPPEIVRDAILYRLVVIGEAVTALPEELKASRPEINWKGISGLRTILTHEYFRIDRARIDDIVDQHLDPLEASVGELLAERQ